MHERLTKESVKVVKAKSAKLQGARACTREKKDFTDIYKSCSNLARGCPKISKDRG